ncbi:MAG TPA: deoxyribodipyrimidine photo-lyase, partial [Flavobacteriales bacterium]|nr:deoxyribodipyrimidine photo-lyase [Flavobacteriales bacterium]
AVWKDLISRFDIAAVTTARDHEPYARTRDGQVAELLAAHGIEFVTVKDISIHERDEVMKDDGTPYTVFTPYARKWRAILKSDALLPFPSENAMDRLWRGASFHFPSLAEIGFASTDLLVPTTELAIDVLKNYENTRNLPAIEGTSRMSIHLRFGTVSTRQLVRTAFEQSPGFLNELIWREFFMQILWHFPNPERAFKPAYDRIVWQHDETAFEAWCEGRTGYPLVDAGMRELKATGHMHNRVRMVVASFLCKHLLLDWRLGEAWFASELLDFELSSNNGNWQWASGSGCDAAPYFRVFNPELQQQRFDPGLKYVKRWVPEHGTADYVRRMVVHASARLRAIATYKAGLSGTNAEHDTQNELFA